MKSIKIAVIVLVSALSLTACTEPLVGTWNVANYETVSPSQQGVSLSNIGTITFNKDESGNRDMHYNVLGIQHDDTESFTWTLNENAITIKSDDSDFAKTWLIKKNTKNLQRWQSTNGRGQVQSMELRR